MKVPFAKVEGLANDFVLIDARAGGAWLTPEAAARWCDRRRGVGADGVLTLLPGPGQGLLHIYNADGSEAEMCGNGLRCAVLALDPSGEPVRVATAAGPRGGAVVGPDRVRSDMGTAAISGRFADHRVPEASEAGWRVSMGNPHLVLFVDAEPGAVAERHGARLSSAPAFSDGVNVGFARPEVSGALELVVYERGSGITQACGTGAAAAAVAAHRSGRAGDDVEVRLPGGSCRIFMRGDAVELEGPARIVYRGTLELSDADTRQRE